MGAGGGGREEEQQPKYRIETIEQCWYRIIPILSFSLPEKSC
jgi:hypothetical protein